jgi:hypothetical protein
MQESPVGIQWSSPQQNIHMPHLLDLPNLPQRKLPQVIIYNLFSSLPEFL